MAKAHRVIIYEEPGITFYEPQRNQWHLPAVELKRELQNEGFTILGEHEATPEPSDIAIYMDALMRPKHPMLHDRSIYIALEPPVTSPRLYQRLKPYGWPYTRVLTFAREYVDSKRVFWIPYPCVRYEPLNPLERNSERLCAISSNITRFNDAPGQLYTLRRSLYLAIGKHLDLFGRDWDRDTDICINVNYSGVCASNYDMFSNYANALSIENCWLYGYASEKYWTPIQAGCAIQRIGWTPDYSLSDCDQYAYAKTITQHIKDIC